MGSILYAQSSGTQQTQSGAWTPIPGLKLTLPDNSSGRNTAMVTLNVPNPYASGNNFPGGNSNVIIDSPATLSAIVDYFS
jgi:hypothetical protein